MASPNISFDSIPSSIRKPGKYAEFNLALAVRTLPGNRQKVLFTGQRLAAGSVAAGLAVDVFDDAQAAAYFGRGSVAHRMVRAALRANPYMALQVIADDDAGAAIAATNTVTVTGPATVAGVLSVAVGEDLVEIAYAIADAANSIAAALKAQFDNQPDLAVTAGVVAGVVTLTAKNKGTVGNQLKFSAKVTANSGVTVAVTQPANGATDPTAATLLAAVFAAGHDIVGSAWNDQTNLTALRDHLDSVGGPLEKRGAVGIFGWTGSLATGTTLANAINGKRLSCALVPGAYAPAYEVAAKYAAIVASEEDPARPLNGLALTGLLAPALSNRLSRTEQENALYNGTTPTEVGPGEVVQIVRAITTYTKDPQGVADISLLDLTTIRTLDYARKAWVERVSLRFARAKKTKAVMAQIREELLDVSYKLEELGILQNVKENESGYIVEEDLQDPSRVNCRIPADVVNGLHVVAMRIDLIL